MRKWRAARFAMNWVPNEIFDEVMDIWKISSLYGDCGESQMCHDKTTFRLKTDPAIHFWTLKIGLLSCSARVRRLDRRLTGILRRAHVTIFIVDYGYFRSQLSGFSRIFEDFDWAPAIFTQDVQRKTYGILLWKYFPKTKSKIGHGGPTQNWILRRTTVTKFSKTFLVFYK